MIRGTQLVVELKAVRLRDAARLLRGGPRRTGHTDENGDVIEEDLPELCYGGSVDEFVREMIVRSSA